MMLPTEMIALAEARRANFEKEMRLLNQVAALPQPPSRWRQWTGGGLMWAGRRLVNWGEGMAMTNCPQRVEVIS
jgi:hypothetical protein